MTDGVRKLELEDEPISSSAPNLPPVFKSTTHHAQRKVIIKNGKDLRDHIQQRAEQIALFIAEHGYEGRHIFPFFYVSQNEQEIHPLYRWAMQICYISEKGVLRRHYVGQTFKEKSEQVDSGMVQYSPDYDDYEIGWKMTPHQIADFLNHVSLGLMQYIEKAVANLSQADTVVYHAHITGAFEAFALWDEAWPKTIPADAAGEGNDDE